MASSPITSWQIGWETMKTVTDFIFLGSKITMDSDCSHKIKRLLLLGQKAMTYVAYLKSETSLCQQSPYGQNYGFSSSHVWMWELDQKKAERRRIDAFKLWYWRKLLRVLWTARRSNKSIVKEINPEYSLEGLMLKLRLQYFGHLMWRANSLEKTPDASLIRGWQRMRWLEGITRIWATPRDSGGQRTLACCSPWGCKESYIT